MECSHGRPHIIDELKCLRCENTVISIGWNYVSGSQIRHDGRFGIIFGRVKYIYMPSSLAAELFGIDIIADFQHICVHIFSVTRYKSFDVVAVDGLTPIKAEL